jgi:HSP20 family protein
MQFDKLKPNDLLTSKIFVMAFVRINTKPAPKSFNNLVDDFFAGIPSIIQDEVLAPVQKPSVPVNVRETENDYVLEIFAPGMEKENFSIHLENNILTVSGERKTEAVNQNEKQIIKEFKLQSFKRSFTIDEKTDSENIVAKYLNGVLTLNLPKKSDVKEAAKQITVL